MIKYFCDICGEQIRYPNVLKQTRTLEFKSFNWGLGDCNLQICRDCYAEILKFIETMKKKEKEQPKEDKEQVLFQGKWIDGEE